MGRNREMVLMARQLLCKTLGVLPPCPDEMIGSLACIPLPAESPLYEFVDQPPGVTQLQDLLFHRFAIEVPVMPSPTVPKHLLRISAQLYNTKAQYEYLARAIALLLESQ